MFRATVLVLAALLMNLHAKAAEVQPPASLPPWHGVASIGDDGAILLKRYVVKYVMEQKTEESTVIVTKLSGGEPVQREETRATKVTVCKPVAECRPMKYEKENFRITQGGRVVDPAENPALFREPTPVLVTEYSGKAMAPFYAQFVADNAFVVYVRANTPKMAGGPIHIVEATRDAELSRLQELDSFVELHLLGDEITDEGLRQINALDDLKRLYIGSKSVTDEGLKLLASISNLQLVNLSGTDVSDEAVAELKKALPKCQIRR